MRIILSADPAIPVPPRGYGGIERIVDSLARYYRSKGHEVGLLAHAASECPTDRLFPWDGANGDLARNTMLMARAAREFRADAIHSFSRLAYLGLSLRSGIPKVMSYQRHTGGWQISAAAWLAKRSLRFTGCSEFISSMGRAQGGLWTTIYNFVEPGKFTFSKTIPPDSPLVFLSRIESIKGADLAIAIARACRRRLILAGNRADSGPELDFWKERIEGELGREGVEWVGEVGDAQKAKLLSTAWALIVPIQWDEPFGIVFAEALASGTPVITCRRGAASEIVQEGVTGFFVDGVRSGVEAVDRVAGLDRGACRRSAEERFSLEVCGDAYIGLLKEMAG